MNPVEGEQAGQTYEPPRGDPSTFLDTGRTTILPPQHKPGVQRLPADGAPRFESFGELGVGGLGQVLAAHDLDIGRKVAIKRMREDRRGPSEQIRFIREVRTVGALEHPNIVTIHDVGREADGGLYFVMNYIDGETMEAILDRLRAGDAQTHAQWPFSRRLNLFHQLLHALSFAHEAGVLHRDIKPANIMIGRHGQVQLVDWGIAKHLATAPSRAQAGPARSGPPAAADTLVPEELSAGTLVPSEGSASRDTAQTRAGSLIGTPRYMAPEQARGEPVDVRSETYTLSLVLYEWLTLQHPLDGLESIDEILAAAREQAVPFPSQLHPHQPMPPADMIWFFMDGLRPDPSDRYPSVRAMIERLEARDEGDIPGQCAVTRQKRMLHQLDALLDRNAVLATLALFAASGLAMVGVLAILAALLAAVLGSAVAIVS